MRHGTSFRRRLSARHAGAAPHSAVAELGVVRRCYAQTQTTNMKSLRVLITTSIAGIIVSAGFTSCNKPSSQPIAETTPVPLPPPPVSAPPPLAVSSATPPPATPQPNYLAPDGVFFLIVATSVETKDGIAGLPPGTRAVKQPDGRYLAGGHLVELRPDQVTNDLRIASRIAGADQAAQAQIRQASASEAKALERQRQEQAQQQAAADQVGMAAKAKSAAQRQARIAVLCKEIAEARSAKANWSVKYDSEELNVLNTKIRALQQELSRLGVGGSALE